MRVSSAAVVPVLAVFLACGPKTPPHVVIHPAMATLVPPDTVMLAGARLDQLRETPLYRRYVASPGRSSLSDLISKTGVKPENLWEALAAYNGADTVVMLRGKFSETGLEPRLEWEGARRDSYKGCLIISDGRAGVAFINATTAVAGLVPRVRAAIDQRGGATRPPPALLSMTGGIDPSNQIWAVALGGPPLPAGETRGPMLNFARVLHKIDRFRAMANLHDGMVFSAEAECARPEDAETLLSALQAFVGLGRFALKDRPAMTAALDALSLLRNEATVQVNATLPASVVDELIQEAAAADSR